ncbi:MAG: hypothetical protein ACYTGA_13465 [Planctomycetota bacterium]|jgi:hypothetical protein
MKLRSSIFWVLLLQCALFAASASECPQFSDPNDYIDDPNTLDNGLFECGDSNLTQYGFTPPIFWERTPHPLSPNQNDCYAALYPTDPNLLHPYIPFVPNPEKGQPITWTIPAPIDGQRFVILSTGDLQGVNDNQISGSIISQKISLSVGDTILGSYFFGTCDYYNFNDHGEIYLEFLGDPNAKHIIVDPSDPNDMCATGWVDDYGSTEGWKTFEYTIKAGMAGSYKICCKVEDGGSDNVYKSYFAINGMRICRGGQSDADLDHDCDVDLLDYSILSRAWLVADCSEIIDPNSVLYDPDIPCEDADIDDSRFVGDPDIWVDSNDLMIMSSEWLMNPPSE